MKPKKKQFVVIGMGRFGMSLAKTLYASGHEVMAVDSNAERIEDVSEFVTHAVQADVTDEDALQALGVRNFDVAVVSIGTDVQSSILVTLLLKEMGIPLVIAKALSDLHAKVLYRIGADRVIFPERDMGVRLAQSLTMRNIMETIELSEQYKLAEAHVPEVWVGKSLRDLDVRANCGLNVVAIRRGGRILASPHGDDVFEKEDLLVVIGMADDLKHLESL